MSIGTSSLRIIGIKQPKKKKFNGKQEAALKPQKITPHLWKLQYNINHQGRYESSYMKCYEILFIVCCLL